ncbi:MAG: bifunctional phosphopantothenoylcysteine decarboxylase/phosphopantothenate--cysteine ligase CoaBC [Bacteroidetes bacterium]|nr:bifunctional phosphopantothenoylcysteine decarboxylase/phosphopantothenate--cysteine ligase CoaBC [Bacteroidota bacterium]
MLRGKKIIIGITGSIAAYKIPFLIRLLKKAGAEVQVVMTPFAAEFVTPLTLSTLTEKPVLTDFFDKGDGSWHSHVDLGLWADIILVAPLSANTMAKMATGIADNLLLTVLLSARCPVYFAPAMDLDMYKHPSTKKNIETLQLFGYSLIEPTEGELASGLKGFGRLEEPEKIFSILKNALIPDSLLQGKKVLISAGPTFEPIDPVRYIGNKSSGLMGIELAKAFANKGADVRLVLGPTRYELHHPLIQIQNVTTAGEMHQSISELSEKMEIIVMAAAVADFTPEKVEQQKIKKSGKKRNIQLKPTVDILKELGNKKHKNQILIGFSLETENEKENATKKLKSKNLDMIVLNSLRDKGAGFETMTNKVSLIDKRKKITEIPLKLKSEIAQDIVTYIENELMSVK